MKALGPRVCLYTHFAFALYVMSCGLLDCFGLSQEWMIPNVTVFYLLIFSAIPFVTIGAFLAVWRKEDKKGMVILTHIILGVAQIIGPLPLVI
ncbi:hypothetical protein DDZ13_15055 [Coraliomargarita sinensis]|uniref:Uncharacterized protein n=1 Tax=Coraliomargarita sinensis TaxID=2174842 RepID=A0A317ZCI2_9BACT|nr:hypothetical protein DDZ13_15055 [Coraliomargarita sinensis]